MKTLSLVILLNGFLADQFTVPGTPPPAPDPVSAPSDNNEASAAFGPCATPRLAVGSWLDTLQVDSFDAQKAARCVAGLPGVDQAEVENRVLKLKQILDEKGIFVRIDQLPDDLSDRKAAGCCLFQVVHEVTIGLWAVFSQVCRWFVMY